MNKKDDAKVVGMDICIWCLIVLVIALFVAHWVTTHANAQELTVTKTCESVVVEIEGVNWEWPSTWLNGPLICYPGEPDRQREIVNMDGKTVTFTGSESALRILGVVP